MYILCRTIDGIVLLQTESLIAFVMSQSIKHEFIVTLVCDVNLVELVAKCMRSERILNSTI